MKEVAKHVGGKEVQAAMHLHERGKKAFDEVRSKVDVGEAAWGALKLVHERKMEDAIMAWKEAALAGHPIAQLNLGEIYEHGHGAVKDYTEAASYYKMAATSGVAEAQHNLGMLYKRGQGLEKSDELAAEFVRKAADQGLADAQHKMGKFCARGKGVNEDTAAAVEWLSKAARQGHEKAKADLDTLKATGSV